MLLHNTRGAVLNSFQAICIAWKQRQKRLGVDDFGVPLTSAGHAGEIEPLLANGH